MKEKLMSYKKIIICVCAAAAVIAAAVLLLSNKEESFRSIMVYDVEGNAVIERASVGTMDAVENLYLESGDRVSVAADSGMRMKLDDDKYVMAEADTVFSVEAAGTDADSRTKISLEQGAITNEIQHPLSEGSQFETSTPNSVMAVRGTIYRVELYVDEDSGNGDKLTKLSCFQGQVGTKPILPDGSFGEEVLVPAGAELSVYPDGTVSEVRDIAYDELPAQAVENLRGMMENGQDVTGITLEELAQLTSETADASEAPESGSEQIQQSEAAQSGQFETAGADEQSDAEQAADTQIHTKADTEKTDKAKLAKTEQTKDGQTAPAPQPPKKMEPANNGSADNGNTGGGSQEGNSGSNQGGSDQDKPNQPDKPDQPDKPNKPKTYTVTFMYEGRVFATQTVKNGKTVTAPMLSPDQGGAWDFDFTTKIKKNTTVSWKKAE